MFHDGLIFDLDGTLWDAAASCTRGWNRALAGIGRSCRVSVDGIRSVSGKPFDRCVQILLPELAPAPEAIVRLLEKHERAEIEKDGGVLYPGVAEGIRRLAVTHRLFVVSNCPGWYLEAFFQRTGLRSGFTDWDCHGSSSLSKSGMLLRLCRRHHLANAVYVGDTEGDEHAAGEAGVKFAFVRYGFGEVSAPAVAFGSFQELVLHFTPG